MGKENIVERIISDAETEAAGIVADAEKRAEEIFNAAKLRAERNAAGVKAETEQKCKAILDGKAASARLDCAKIELAEKRRVLDAVYENALQKLISLGKEKTLALANKLIENYADVGDEIAFSQSFKYAEDVKNLAAFKNKKLTVSKDGAKTEGGFILRGEKCDKDISYGALLAADREKYQAEVAAEIFKKD